LSGLADQDRLSTEDSIATDALSAAEHGAAAAWRVAVAVAQHRGQLIAVWKKASKGCLSNKTALAMIFKLECQKDSGPLPARPTD